MMSDMFLQFVLFSLIKQVTTCQSAEITFLEKLLHHFQGGQPFIRSLMSPMNIST
jgi:hypothetical protein